MICDKCVHKNACINAYASVGYFVDETKVKEHSKDILQCEQFADKSKFIELPFKVGDIITALWDVPTTSKYVPYLAEVKEFRQSKRNGEVVCTVSVEPIEYRGRRKEYSVSEFGKLLFFSYDEAAKALKERVNNGNG